MADVALTREAGKNAKLAALLEEAGISSVEVMKSVLYSTVMSVCWPLQSVCVFTHFYFPVSGQAVVTDVVPSPPRFFPLIFIAHRVQQSHSSSIFH